MKRSLNYRSKLVSRKITKVTLRICNWLTKSFNKNKISWNWCGNFKKYRKSIRFKWNSKQISWSTNWMLFKIILMRASRSKLCTRGCSLGWPGLLWKRPSTVQNENTSHQLPSPNKLQKVPGKLEKASITLKLKFIKVNWIMNQTKV